MAIYIVMGWVAPVAVAPLLQWLDVAGFAWLVAGGVFYIGGIVFMRLTRA